MATGPRQDVTGASRVDGKRTTKKVARAIPVPDRYDYQLIRHLAGSRIPFSIGYVESLVQRSGKASDGELDVAGAVGDAHAWGWIDHLAIGTWMGRL